MNTVTLIGNLGRDPELRQTTTGKKVATLSLATTERWKNSEGERQEHTEWHTVVCWGRQAEVAKEYLLKGKQIAVVGKIRTRSWIDQATQVKKYRTEIICDNFEMLSPAPRREEAPDAGFDPSEIESEPATGTDG